MCSVCFLSYIPFGNPCVQTDYSQLLVCAYVHVFISGAALRFYRGMCCSVVLVRVACLCSSSIKESIPVW